MREDILLEAFYVFNREPTNLDFYTTIDHHSTGAYAYVIRTDDLFLLAREVVDEGDDRDLVDNVAESNDSTHLHVTLAVGDLSKFVPLIPDHIKTLSFQRRGYRIHRMSVERLVNLTNGNAHTPR